MRTVLEAAVTAAVAVAVALACLSGAITGPALVALGTGLVVAVAGVLVLTTSALGRPFG